MSSFLLYARGVALVILLAVAPVLMARLLPGRPVARGWRRRSPAHRRARAPRPAVVAYPHRAPWGRRPTPVRRPLQLVAADLRRLDREFSLVATGAPLVRWRALWAAYDQVLMEAAEQLEVPHTLPDLAVGIPRDIERLRVVSALEARGLVVRG